MKSVKRRAVVAAAAFVLLAAFPVLRYATLTLAGVIVVLVVWVAVRRWLRREVAGERDARDGDLR